MQTLAYSTGVLIAQGHDFHPGIRPSIRPGFLPVRRLPRRRVDVTFADLLRCSSPGSSPVPWSLPGLGAGAGRII